MDEQIQNLLRSANNRDDLFTAIQSLIRIGYNPLLLFEDLANKFGEAEDIDTYLDLLADDPYARHDFGEKYGLRCPHSQIIGYHPERNLRLAKGDAFFDKDFALNFLKQEIVFPGELPWQPSYARNYKISEVLRVYALYCHVEKYSYDHFSDAVGMVADVILDNIPTTVWAELYYASSDDDVTYYRKCIKFFEQPRLIKPHVLRLIRILRTAPPYAQSKLLPFLEKIFHEFD